MRKKPKSHNAEEIDFEVEIWRYCPMCMAIWHGAIRSAFQRGWLTCRECDTIWGIDWAYRGSP